MTADRDYEVRELTDPEKRELSEFLQKHFFEQEPLLNLYYGVNRDLMTEAERKTMAEDMRRKHERILGRRILGAVQRETGEIVGINIFSVAKNPRIYPDLDENNGERLTNVTLESRLLREWFDCVLDVAGGHIDFFEVYPEAKAILEVDIISVNRSHARKGLATRLLQHMIEGTRGSVDVVAGMFTSPFSRKAAQKVGLMSVAELDIMRFRDPRGKVIYEGVEPFNISYMAMKLK